MNRLYHIVTYLLVICKIYEASIKINEVANKGSFAVCDGEDWIELINLNNRTESLNNYTLCDDKGCDDSKAFHITSGYEISGYGMLVLCKKIDFQFGVGSGDTVTLMKTVDGSRILQDETILQGDGVENITWSRVPDALGNFTRTPATANNLNMPVVITEIANKGSNNVCDGEDWIELYNPSSFDVDLSGILLCDDKGCDDEDAFKIPKDNTNILGSGKYLVFCKDRDFQFGIGGGDAITMMIPPQFISKKVQLPDDGEFGTTWGRCWNQTDWVYESLSLATPGQVNDCLQNDQSLVTPEIPEIKETTPIDEHLSCNDYKMYYNNGCCGESPSTERPDIYIAGLDTTRPPTCMQMRHTYKDKLNHGNQSCCKNPTPTKKERTDMYLETIAEPDDEIAFIYRQDVVHNFSITLSSTNMAILDNDPVAENYVRGSLTFNGRVYDNIGIRYKGSVGAWVLCVKGSTAVNPFNLTGERTCDKLSLKVAFDEYDDNNRFHGVRKLLFHSMNNDATRMKDRIGYGLFRAMGVLAPRSNHAVVTINGRTGLYANVEYIDSEFTRSRFGDNGRGNLIKERWPSSDPYLPEPTAQYFRSGLRYNKGTASVDRVVSFAKNMSHDGKTTLARNMRIHYVSRFIAVDRAIGHEDGPMHIRCEEGKCKNKNVYLYEKMDSAGGLWFIPWDLDLTFMVNTYTINDQILQIGGDWRDLDYPCSPLRMYLGGLPQIPPSCESIFRTMATHYMDSYKHALDSLLNNPYYVNINNIIDDYLIQIRPILEEIPYKSAGTFQGFPSIDAAINDLKSRIIEIRHRLLDTPANNSVKGTFVTNSCTEEEDKILPGGFKCSEMVQKMGCDTASVVCPKACGKC